MLVNPEDRNSQDKMEDLAQEDLETSIEKSLINLYDVCVFQLIVLNDACLDLPFCQYRSPDDHEIIRESLEDIMALLYSTIEDIDNWDKFFKNDEDLQKTFIDYRNALSIILAVEALVIDLNRNSPVGNRKYSSRFYRKRMESLSEAIKSISIVKTTLYDLGTRRYDVPTKKFNSGLRARAKIPKLLDLKVYEQFLDEI